MKIVILTGSPHKHGTSNTLVDEFIRGVDKHDIKRFDTPFLKIHPCIGCNACKMDGDCIFKDDMPKILDAIIESDLIVFATPIYYFGFSAQIKSAIDRFHAKNIKLQGKKRKAIFIATSFNDDDLVMNSFEKHIEILTDYLNLDNIANIFAKGYGYIGADKEDFYKEKAYHLGKQL